MEHSPTSSTVKHDTMYFPSAIFCSHLLLKSAQEDKDGLGVLGEKDVVQTRADPTVPVPLPY